MLELFDPAIIDPNFVYLALLVGLWVGVTAAYIPGTGVAELAAVLLLVASFVLLTMLPTNWLAALLLVLGVSAFLVMPFFGERWGHYAEGGLVLQALGGYFLFEGSPVSPLLIGVTLLIGVLYNRAVLIPTMRNQRRHSEYDESNIVLGVRGRVVKDLDPVGTVYVNKELWRARSDQTLTKDTPVVVTAQEGLELFVEKAKTEDAPAYMRHSENGSGH